ncbi:MAG TPA: sulfite exporter TauE/SafE family protein, partial [Pseudomonadales bacterium]|nr:sulfite exporter TauE/SafE family protein [Pseudomonadales bacterium]
MITLPFLIFCAASLAAGIVNTLAGGGSFLTFPALLLTGLDPRAANMTSTIALFPMQITSGYAGRKMAGGTPALSFKALFVISLIGGAVGAGLLLLTPPTTFGKMVPWLILFATGCFAYGSFRKKSTDEDHYHLGRKGS